MKLRGAVMHSLWEPLTTANQEPQLLRSQRLQQRPEGNLTVRRLNRSRDDVRSRCKRCLSRRLRCDAAVPARPYFDVAAGAWLSPNQSKNGRKKR